MERTHILFFQRLSNGIDNGPDLGRAFTGADNKIIGKVADTLRIQKHYIRGLFIADDIDNFMS
jgi:hypothetical protein